LLEESLDALGKLLRENSNVLQIIW